VSGRVSPTVHPPSPSARRQPLLHDYPLAADRRENDHALAELLAPQGEQGYGGDWPERRNAVLDRGYAKDDRTASRDDRLALTGDDAEDETVET
jgi:hypothetical protein